jgi:serine/threonine protein kinase
MLTGKLPFEADTDAALIRAQIESKPPELKDLGVSVPAALESVLRKSLAKNPNDRFRTADEMSRSLDECVAGQAISREFSYIQINAIKHVLLQQKAGVAILSIAVVLLSAVAAIRLHERPKRLRLVDQATSAEPISGPTPAQPEVSSLGPSIVIAPPATPQPAAPAPSKTPDNQPRDRNRTNRASDTVASLSAGARKTPAEKQPNPVARPEISNRVDTLPAALPEAAPPSPAATTATRSRITSLSDVHSLYITSPNTDLTTSLREEIAHEFNGNLRFPSSAAAADATLRIDLEDGHGNRMVRSAGRFLGMKAGRKATAQVIAADNKRCLWSAEAGDRQALAGAWGDGARRIASRIARDLHRDWRGR